MATKLKDIRLVRVRVSRAQLANLVGEKALAVGMIDFDPDRVEVHDQGDNGFELTFELDLPSGG